MKILNGWRNLSYINLGFEHFYLYENEGSTGGDGNKQFNRYGFPANTSASENNTQLFQQLLSKYSKYITHILWQPKDNYGNIIYGHNESILDCLTKYGKDNEWIAFVDMDEFIFSEKDIHLVDYLKSLDDTISNVKLIQKKFLDRFLTGQKLITQEFGCIANLHINEGWAPKNIIRCKYFDYVNNIHHIRPMNIKNGHLKKLRAKLDSSLRLHQ